MTKITMSSDAATHPTYYMTVGVMRGDKFVPAIPSESADRLTTHPPGRRRQEMGMNMGAPLSGLDEYRCPTTGRRYVVDYTGMGGGITVAVDASTVDPGDFVVRSIPSPRGLGEIVMEFGAGRPTPSPRTKEVWISGGWLVTSRHEIDWDAAAAHPEYSFFMGNFFMGNSGFSLDDQDNRVYDNAESPIIDRGIWDDDDRRAKAAAAMAVCRPVPSREAVS